MSQEVDGKDDIYWLRKSSCFELYGGGKYDLFSAEKLMERWYLIGLFELSMIFQDLGSTFFRAVIYKSKNSKTSDPHRLLLNLSDKINLKRSKKYVAL